MNSRTLLRFVALAVPAIVTLDVSAQSAPGAPWYGVEVPTHIELPAALSVLADPSFAAPRAATPAGEERYVELEGARIWPLLEDIVGFARESRARGDAVWGRVSGFPAAEQTASWVEERFRDAGLTSVAMQRYDADEGAGMWWADHWEVRLLGDPAFGAGSADVILTSAVPARAVEIPGRMLTAPLVYAGDAVTPPTVDVAGKVAVQRIRPASGAFGQRAAIQEGSQALLARGAVGVLNYVDQPGNMHVRDFSGCGVCFNIGGKDGAFVRAVAEQAAHTGTASELRVRMYLDASVRPGLSAHNVMGIVQGASDEIVIVNAHLDGWYDAAGDNGDGLAVLVALARHFAKPENRPARTLLFVASGGHHSTGLNGPSHFVRTNPELAGRAVLVLNLEHIAQYLIDTAEWQVERTEQPMGWGVTNMAPYVLELTDRAVERYGFRLRPEYSTSVAGDLGGYAPLGVPRVQAIHAGPLYHTSGDVLGTISVEGLERSARFYAYFIDGVTRASRAQLDP